jgi:hypothetical protein
MVESIEYGRSVRPLWWFPPAGWLPGYRVAYLPSDLVAGITLAAQPAPDCQTCPFFLNDTTRGSSDANSFDTPRLAAGEHLCCHSRRPSPNMSVYSKLATDRRRRRSPIWPPPPIGRCCTRRPPFSALM